MPDGKDTYTVQPGESWASIAGKLYGDQREFLNLFQANPHLKTLKAGDVLYVPPSERSRTGNAPFIPKDVFNQFSPGTSMGSLSNQVQGPVSSKSSKFDIRAESTVPKVAGWSKPSPNAPGATRALVGKFGLTGDTSRGITSKQVSDAAIKKEMVEGTSQLLLSGFGLTPGAAKNIFEQYVSRLWSVLNYMNRVTESPEYGLFPGQVGWDKGAFGEATRKMPTAAMVGPNNYSQFTLGLGDQVAAAFDFYGTLNASTKQLDMISPMGRPEGWMPAIAPDPETGLPVVVVNMNMPLEGDQGYIVTLTPEQYQQLSWSDIMHREPTVSERLAQQRYDIVRLIWNPDTNKVDWEVLFGKHVWTPNMFDAFFQQQGMATTAFSFAAHPERVNKFIKMLDQGVSPQQAAADLQDIGFEMFMHTVTDPTMILNFIPETKLIAPLRLADKLGDITEESTWVLKGTKWLVANYTWGDLSTDIFAPGSSFLFKGVKKYWMFVGASAKATFDAGPAVTDILKRQGGFKDWFTAVAKGSQIRMSAAAIESTLRWVTENQEVLRALAKNDLYSDAKSWRWAVDAATGQAKLVKQDTGVLFNIVEQLLSESMIKASAIDNVTTPIFDLLPPQMQSSMKHLARNIMDEVNESMASAARAVSGAVPTLNPPGNVLKVDEVERIFADGSAYKPNWAVVWGDKATQRTVFGEDLERANAAIAARRAGARDVKTGLPIVEENLKYKLQDLNMQYAKNIKREAGKYTKEILPDGSVKYWPIASGEGATIQSKIDGIIQAYNRPYDEALQNAAKKIAAGEHVLEGTVPGSKEAAKIERQIAAGAQARIVTPMPYEQAVNVVQSVPGYGNIASLDFLAHKYGKDIGISNVEQLIENPDWMPYLLKHADTSIMAKRLGFNLQNRGLTGAFTKLQLFYKELYLAGFTWVFNNFTDNNTKSVISYRRFNWNIMDNGRKPEAAIHTLGMVMPSSAINTMVADNLPLTQNQGIGLAELTQHAQLIWPLGSLKNNADWMAQHFPNSPLTKVLQKVVASEAPVAKSLRNMGYYKFVHGMLNTGGKVERSWRGMIWENQFAKFISTELERFLENNPDLEAELVARIRKSGDVSQAIMEWFYIKHVDDPSIPSVMAIAPQGPTGPVWKRIRDRMNHFDRAYKGARSGPEYWTKVTNMLDEELLSMSKTEEAEAAQIMATETLPFQDAAKIQQFNILDAPSVNPKLLTNPNLMDELYRGAFTYIKFDTSGNFWHPAEIPLERSGEEMFEATITYDKGMLGLVCDDPNVPPDTLAHLEEVLFNTPATVEIPEAGILPGSLTSLDGDVAVAMKNSRLNYPVELLATDGDRMVSLRGDVREPTSIIRIANNTARPGVTFDMSFPVPGGELRANYVDGVATGDPLADKMYILNGVEGYFSSPNDVDISNLGNVMVYTRSTGEIFVPKYGKKTSMKIITENRSLWRTLGKDPHILNGPVTIRPGKKGGAPFTLDPLMYVDTGPTKLPGFSGDLEGELYSNRTVLDIARAPDVGADYGIIEDSILTEPNMFKKATYIHTAQGADAPTIKMLLEEGIEEIQTSKWADWVTLEGGERNRIGDVVMRYVDGSKMTEDEKVDLLLSLKPFREMVDRQGLRAIYIKGLGWRYSLGHSEKWLRDAWRVDMDDVAMTLHQPLIRGNVEGRAIRGTVEREGLAGSVGAVENGKMQLYITLRPDATIFDLEDQYADILKVLDMPGIESVNLGFQRILGQNHSPVGLKMQIEEARKQIAKGELVRLGADHSGSTVLLTPEWFKRSNKFTPGTRAGVVIDGKVIWWKGDSLGVGSKSKAPPLHPETRGETQSYQEVWQWIDSTMDNFFRGLRELRETGATTNDVLEALGTRATVMVYDRSGLITFLNSEGGAISEEVGEALHRSGLPAKTNMAMASLTGERSTIPGLFEEVLTSAGFHNEASSVAHRMAFNAREDQATFFDLVTHRMSPNLDDFNDQTSLVQLSWEGPDNTVLIQRLDGKMVTAYDARSVATGAGVTPPVATKQRLHNGVLQVKPDYNERVNVVYESANQVFGTETDLSVKGFDPSAFDKFRFDHPGVHIVGSGEGKRHAVDVFDFVLGQRVGTHRRWSAVVTANGQQLMWAFDMDHAQIVRDFPYPTLNVQIYKEADPSKPMIIVADTWEDAQRAVYALNGLADSISTEGAHSMQRIGDEFVPREPLIKLETAGDYLNTLAVYVQLPEGALVPDPGYAPNAWFGTLGQLNGQEMQGLTLGAYHRSIQDAEISRRLSSSLEMISQSHDDVVGKVQEWKTNIAAYQQGSQKRVEATRLGGTADAITANMLIKQWFKHQMKAAENASTQLAQTAFDYNVFGNVENVMKGIFPFVTWQMRNPFLWAQMLGSHPNVALFYYRLFNELQRNNQQRNLTSRFDRFMPIGPIPGQEGSTLAVGVNPIASFQLQQPFVDPSEETVEFMEKQTPLQRQLLQYMQMGQYAGMQPLPWIGQGMEAFGVMPQDPMRWFGGFLPRLVQGLLTAGGAITAGEQPFTGEIANTSRYLLESRTRKRISELEAASGGEISHEEALQALYNPESELYQQAYGEVSEQMGKEGLLSLLPMRWKMMSKEETEFRQIQKEIKELNAQGEYAEAQKLRDLNPAYETYIASMGTKEQADVKAVYAHYDPLISATVPWDPKRKELIAERSNELAKLLPPQMTKPINYQDTASIYHSGLIDTKGTTPEQTLYNLTAIEPKPVMFNRDVGIDWDAYNQSLDYFINNISMISEKVGVHVTSDDYISWKYRYGTPTEVAYTLYKDWRSDAYAEVEATYPGGENYMKLMQFGLEKQFINDIAAGASYEEAQQRKADTFAQWSANGIPYVYRSEFLGEIYDTKNLSDFTVGTAKILGIDATNLRDLRASLDVELPGIGDKIGGDVTEAHKNLNNYYYNLTPQEQDQVDAYLQIGNYTSGYLKTDPKTPKKVNLSDLTDEQAYMAWSKIRANFQGVKHYAGRNLINAPEAMQEPLPTWDALTDDEIKTMNKASLDMWRYSNDQAHGLVGVWTPEMEEMYDDPTSGSGRFWAYVNSRVFTNDVYNLEKAGIIMSSGRSWVVSHMTKPEQDKFYEEALRELQAHEAQVINQPLVDVIKEHPDWYELAQTQRDALTRNRVLAQEDDKAIYNSQPYGDDRDEWAARPENHKRYIRLQYYMVNQRANEVENPFYLFFYRPNDYQHWYGNTPPDQISQERAHKLAEVFRDNAFAAIDAKVNQNTWTYIAKRFLGPFPKPRYIQPKKKKSSSGSSSGGDTNLGNPPKEPGIPPPPSGS